MTVQVMSSPPGVVQEGTRWQLTEPGQLFQCQVAIVEKFDGFSAHALSLPGVVGEGDTIDAAVRDISATLRDVLSEYIASGKIPWSATEVEIADQQVVGMKWILVDLHESRLDALDLQAAREAMSDPREIPYEEIRRNCGLE